MKNQNKKTVLELENTDCAIILRESGVCELALPSASAKDEISPTELLASGIVTFLRDPKFVEMIKSEFIKNIQFLEKKEQDKKNKSLEKTED